MTLFTLPASISPVLPIAKDGDCVLTSLHFGCPAKFNPNHLSAEDNVKVLRDRLCTELKQKEKSELQHQWDVGSIRSHLGVAPDVSVDDIFYHLPSGEEYVAYMSKHGR
jgi:hypothetical protein